MRHPGIRIAGVVIAAFISAAVIPALSSCFSDRQAVTDPVPATGECRIPTSSTAAGTVVIFIRDFTFIPQQVSIKRGTRVTWVNCEDPTVEPHTSTSDSGIWDSSSLRPGDVYSRTFDDPTGTVRDYHCVPHPFMKGTVNVD